VILLAVSAVHAFRRIASSKPVGIRSLWALGNSFRWRLSRWLLGDAASAQLQSFPSVGIWLMTGLIVFSPLLEGGTTHVAAMITRLLILAMLLAYVWDGIRAGAFPLACLRLRNPMLAFLALAALSTARSSYSDQSLQWLTVLLSYAGLLYLLESFLREWDYVKWPLAALAGMGLVEAVTALVQGWGLGATRPTGTFFNPNFLAGYLAAIFSVVLGVVCYDRDLAHFSLRSGRRGAPLSGLDADSPTPTGTRAQPRGAPPWRGWRGLVLLVPATLLMVLLAAIVCTGSRGGVLALIAGAATVLSVRFGKKALAIVALLVIIAALVPNPVRERLRAEHTTNPVSYARWQMWQSSLHMMAEHPLGLGLGLYQYVYPRYARPVEGEITRYGKVAHAAHNEYLQMGVEAGLAALVVFVWGIVRVSRDAIHALRGRLRRGQRGVIVGCVGAVGSILIHAGTDSNLHEPAIAIVLSLCIGVLLAAPRLLARAGHGPATVPISSRWVWGAVGTATGLVLAGAVVSDGFAWILYDRGQQAMARGDAAGALVSYQRASTLDPGKALYHSALGAAHFRTFQRTREAADAQAALDHLQTAMALNPLDGRLPELLGDVCVRLAGLVTPSTTQQEHRSQLLVAARRAYERAVELDPYRAWYHYELGRTAMALGDAVQAEQAVRRAVELEPNFLPGREWLARRFLRAGQRDAALAELSEIRERQRRYAGWVKDPVEQRFLDVDVTSLEGEVEASA
jgi:O-antigen ligase